MRLFINKHVLNQARERGISVNEIKETIQKGTKFIQNEKEKNLNFLDYQEKIKYQFLLNKRLKSW